MGDTSVDDLDSRAARAGAGTHLPPLGVAYSHAALDVALADPSVLAVVGFGAAAPPRHADPRYHRIPLEPVQGPAPFEVWRGGSVVAKRREGEITWADDGDYAWGALTIEEGRHGNLAAAARHAYCVLGAWLADARTPHVLRIWNYLDAINLGAGDSERYREFCCGRAEGMRGIFDAGFPAATAIGVRDGARTLRLTWIAARRPGTALENPRQVSAWRYPRQYGPSAPTFARAMRAPTHSPQLYISGTAAIIGHASHHRDDFAAQLDETLANFDSLLEAAGTPPARRFGPCSLLKTYIRHPADAARAGDLLRARLPAATPLLLLQGDICRRELLIEIDGLQASGS